MEARGQVDLQRLGVKFFPSAPLSPTREPGLGGTGVGVGVPGFGGTAAEAPGFLGGPGAFRVLSSARDPGSFHSLVRMGSRARP